MSNAPRTPADWLELIHLRQKSEARAAEELLNARPHPWTAAVIHEACRLSPRTVEAALAALPARKITVLIEAAATVQRIFNEAFNAFAELLGKLNEAAAGGRLWNRLHRAENEALDFEVRRQLFVTTQAARALVDQSRRIRKKAGIAQDEYGRHVREHFGADDMAEFVSDLRVVAFHVHILDPSTEVTSDKAGHRSRLLLPKSSFEAFENWKPLSQAFIAAYPGDSIDVSEVLARYAAAAAAFQRWLVEHVRQSMAVELGELDECTRAMRARSSRLFWRMLLAPRA